MQSSHLVSVVGQFNLINHHGMLDLTQCSHSFNLATSQTSLFPICPPKNQWMSPPLPAPKSPSSTKNCNVKSKKHRPSSQTTVQPPFNAPASPSQILHSLHNALALAARPSSSSVQTQQYQLLVIYRSMASARGILCSSQSSPRAVPRSER